MAPFLFAVDEDVPGADIVVRTSQIGRQSNCSPEGAIEQGKLGRSKGERLSSRG